MFSKHINGLLNRNYLDPNSFHAKFRKIANFEFLNWVSKISGARQFRGSGRTQKTADCNEQGVDRCGEVKFYF